MKTKYLFLLLFALFQGVFLLSMAQNKKGITKPWEHGNLKVSDEHRYLVHEDGTPFFWLGDTGWLLPKRLDQDEAAYYLSQAHNAGYNVVQVQTTNAVPTMNVYGQYSFPDGFNFKDIDKKGVYGYWDHMDYIIKRAEQQGIYVGMVCVWGSVVRSGQMTVEDAKKYGTFLAERYKDSPNIIWIIGGDTYGDRNQDVWEALAESIRKIDKSHLMTFHPFGRTSSATHLNDKAWMDFNMYQSGHRRYGQKKGDGSYAIEGSTEEDNWRYVENAFKMTPLKPILDAEPSYEGIPQGLHNPAEPLWTADDVRRYAYWSVFAGSCGHTYGHNNIMQFAKPGTGGAYGADTVEKPWYIALKDDGFNQMKFLKNLILTFPYTERIPDQSVIAESNGERYDRVIATRGNDYLLVYNYTNKPMTIDLTKISGSKKKAWWYNPKNGQLTYIGELNNEIVSIAYDGAYGNGNDQVFIAFDSSKNYIALDCKTLPINE